MKKLLVIALLPLAGCVTPGPQSRGPSPAEVVANDPTVACIKRLTTDPFVVQHLGQKIGIGKNSDPTIQMLSDKSKPNDDERQALIAYSSARQSCISLGASYRRTSVPPQVAFAFEQSGQNLTMLYAKLYAGDITYGEFNAMRMANASTLRSQLQEVDRQMAQANAADQARRDAAVGAALQNLQNQQLIQQQQMQQMMPRQTNCRRVFDQVNCTTY